MTQKHYIYYPDGVHLISNNEYHSSAGLSRSALWKLKRSPYHYWYEYLNPDYVRSDPTQTMYLGSLVHTLVLEYELFDEEYAILPDNTNKRTKAGKEEYASFLKTNAHKTIVSRETYEQALKMMDAVLKNDIACNLFTDAKVERSIYFTHEPTGIQCKVRPDAWLGTVVTDLKTCHDASYKAFQYEAMKYGYFLQAAMVYKALESIGIKMDKFIFFCVEKTEPYITATYMLDDEALDYGINVFDELMSRYDECMAANKWPAYDVKTLSVPGWIKFED